jgi:hypothetical protein
LLLPSRCCLKQQELPLSNAFDAGKTATCHMPHSRLCHCHCYSLPPTPTLIIPQQLELPLSNAFDAGKTAACVQLVLNPEAPGRLKPGAIEPVLSVRDTEVRVYWGWRFWGLSFEGFQLNPEAPGRLKPGAIKPVLSVRDTEVGHLPTPLSDLQVHVAKPRNLYIRTYISHVVFGCLSAYICLSTDLLCCAQVPVVSGRTYRNAVVNRAKKAVATCRCVVLGHD